MPKTGKEVDVVDETRILLAQAAHGPLTLVRYDHGGGKLYRDEPRDLIAHFYDAANRELYYRAPDLLRALVDEVQRLRGVDGELDDIRECSKCDLCEDHHG